MEKKVKKLYFTNDFSAGNIQKLKSEGWIIRNAQLAKSDSFIEKADEYGGDVPERYKAKAGGNAKPVAEIEAELKKLAKENVALSEQLAAAQGEFIAFQNDIGAMKARIAELEANTDKSEEEKPKTTKAK